MVKVSTQSKLQNFLFFFVLATLTPSTIQNIKYRLIRSVLSIQSQNFEPPKFAFQEAIQKAQNQKMRDDWEEIKEKIPINLNEHQLQRKNWNPIQELKSSKAQLSEMKFSSDEIQKSIEDQRWVQELPGHLQVRISKAEEKQSILNQNWDLPTWRDYAQKVIQEPAQGTGRPSENISVYRHNSDGSKTTRANILTAGAELVDHGQTEQNIKIKGKIRLLDGLALGDREISIRRFVEGVPRESGRVDVKDGTFEIAISESKGSLFADLVDQKGEIIATGKHKLSENVDDIELKIFDRNNFAATFYNFMKSPDILMNEKMNSLKGEKADYFITALQAEEKTDLSGAFKINKISDQSVSLLRAKAKGFSETITTLYAGSERNIPLFPQSLIEALHSLANEEKYYQINETNGSTVWGQVLYDGKPLQGVSAKILNNDEVSAVYLNGWLPDTQIQTTTSSGYFFFTNLPIGPHTILVERAGVIIGHANIEVDSEATTVVALEISSHLKKVPIKIFDVFTGEPLEAEIQMQSMPESIIVQGSAELNLQYIKKLSYGYIKTPNEDYFPTQFSYFESDDFIHVPLMKQQNLLHYAQASKISYVPDTGIIIGLVPEDDFEVHLSHETTYENSNIVFFNAAGEIVDQGKAGGGFIFFNVPRKTQSVAVVSRKTNLMTTKLIPVESNTTSVLKFHF